MSNKRLLSYDDIKNANGVQHKKPCSDCPWARTALPGWLGDETVEGWLQAVRSESKIMCHTLNGAQCAGAAIFRRNLVMRPRDPKLLVLPGDKELVFASRQEFEEHHNWE